MTPSQVASLPEAEFLAYLDGLTEAELWDLEQTLEAQGQADIQHAKELLQFAAGVTPVPFLRVVYLPPPGSADALGISPQLRPGGPLHPSAVARAV